MSDNKEAVEFAFDKLDGYMAAAQKVFEQYGGDAADLGLFALRVEAASEVIVGLVFLVVLLPLSFHFGSKALDIIMGRDHKAPKCLSEETYLAFKELKEKDELCYSDKSRMIKYEEGGYSENQEIYYVIGSIVSILGSVISAIASMEVWAWVGMFYPEVYAVHKFLL